jgi:hypothetical protein
MTSTLPDTVPPAYRDLVTGLGLPDGTEFDYDLHAACLSIFVNGGDTEIMVSTPGDSQAIHGELVWTWGAYDDLGTPVRDTWHGQSPYRPAATAALRAILAGKDPA